MVCDSGGSAMLKITRAGSIFAAVLFICVTSVGTRAGSLPLSFAWEELPCVRTGVQAHLASSYDRTGGNDDYSNYEWPTGLVLYETPVTIATIQGPGMLTRFWMPHVMARRDFVVKMFFDGEQTPRIDTTSTVVMSQLFSYFTDPNFINTFAGGQTCYEPIPFAKSLRIESANKDMNIWANWHYYQYSYFTFPSDANIVSYSPNLSLNPDLQQARAGMSRMLSCRGQYPGTEDSSAGTAVQSGVMVQPGGSLNLLEAEGPGTVRKLLVRLSDPNDENLQNLSLRVYYDGAQYTSIDVPVGDFFGAGRGRALYASLPLGNNGPGGSFYCYFTMPFHHSIRVSLYNTGPAGIHIASASVEYSPSSFAEVPGYFMAAGSSTVRTGQIYHTILSRAGVGHYVGDLTYAEQDSGLFWFLEGDDVITVDQKETLFGTGMEDAYNGGAYYNWVAVQDDEPEGPTPRSATRALNGILYVDKTATFARADQYRWRITDRIPFTSSIEVKLECRYGNTGSRWRSVAFWYELPALLGFPDLAIIADRWMEQGCGSCGGADLTGDGNVDQADLARLAEKWLSIKGPRN
jgi:hypothetical protein